MWRLFFVHVALIFAHVALIFFISFRLTRAPKLFFSRAFGALKISVWRLFLNFMWCSFFTLRSHSEITQKWHVALIKEDQEFCGHGSPPKWYIGGLRVTASFYGLRKCFDIKNIAFVQFFMNFSKKLSESRNLTWIFVF